MAPPLQRTQTGSRPPTTEIGAVQQGAFSIPGIAPWRNWVDNEEYVPELMWPNSVRMYERMRADAQISALFQATVMAIRRFKWSIDPNGAEEKQADKLSQDYNLPILGAKVNTRLRAKRRFAFDRHIRLAMQAGMYGHYYFEQVGDIDPTDRLWHLRKLAERPPRTIQDFRVADDGGLISIIQNISPGRGIQNWGVLPEIPIDRLVGYVWEQEGANWAGRSWFRDIYKNWVIKDRLLRIDAVNHERAGGVPYIEAHPGATMEEIKQLNDMAKGFRIGDTSGGAVPSGAKLNIARGTNSSVVDSIRYHDEAMARRFMLMVMQLGQTQTGSRALGSTFIDFWAHGLAAIAQWFADTFNEHVIEDDIDWNYGEDQDQVPILTYEYDPEFVATDFANMVSKGAIVMDAELDLYVRKEMGLPDPDPTTARPISTPAAPGDGIDPTEPGSTPQSGDGIKASAGDARVLPPAEPADVPITTTEEG
jgi:hypothetical protein